MTTNTYGNYYSRTGYGFGNKTTFQQNNTEHCTTLNSSSTDTVTQLEFSREGEPLLAASSWDQTIRIWKFDDWSYQNPTYLCGVKETSNNAILRFCFNEDCTRIYYGTTAGEIKDYFFSNKAGTSTYSLGNKFGTSTNTSGTGKTNFMSTSAAKTTNNIFAQQKSTGTQQSTSKFSFGGFSTNSNSFGKSSTGFGAPKLNTPTNVPLSIPGDFSNDNKPVNIPPSQYIVSGLKWNSLYKIVVALTTNSTPERDYPHSWIGYVDPYNPENICVLKEIQYHKIINMDVVDNRAWVILINKDGNPVVATADLNLFGNNAMGRDPFLIFSSEIQSMPTSIATYPSGQNGYILATIQGFIEINAEISPDCKGAKQHFYDGVFRNEASEKSCETYSANCVAICQFDKKIAMVCSRNEVALFNLENGLYRKFIPSAGKVTNKDPITACAFSPSGEIYALAYGYDWSKGAEELKKIKPSPMIVVGNTPEPPKSE